MTRRLVAALAPEGAGMGPASDGTLYYRPVASAICRVT